MTTTYRVETQGISHDYRESNGSFDTINRGGMDQEALLELLNRVRYMEDPASIHNTTELCTPLVTVTGPAGRFSFIVDRDGKFFSAEHETIITPIEAVSVASGLNPSTSSGRSSQKMQQTPPPASWPKPAKKMSFLLKIVILIFILLIVYAAMSDNLDTQAVLAFGVVGSVLWFFFKKGRSSRSSSYGSTYHDTRYETDRVHDGRDNDANADWGDNDDSGSDD
jgi:hypothetical protein